MRQLRRHSGGGRGVAECQVRFDKKVTLVRRELLRIQLVLLHVRCWNELFTGGVDLHCALVSLVHGICHLFVVLALVFLKGVQRLLEIAYPLAHQHMLLNSVLASEDGDAAKFELIAEYVTKLGRDEILINLTAFVGDDRDSFSTVGQTRPHSPLPSEQGYTDAGVQAARLHRWG